MNAKKGRRKRNRMVRIFLFPVLIFIFLIGWSMYRMGDRKRPEKRTEKTKPKAPPKEDDVTFMPVILEEKPEEING